MFQLTKDYVFLQNNHVHRHSDIFVGGSNVAVEPEFRETLFLLLWITFRGAQIEAGGLQTKM